MLKINNLSKGFGGLWALKEINLEVQGGKITSIIGPNGAGKTTLFNCITGFSRPTTGNIVFYDSDITGLPPNRITKTGIARTFQNIRLFKDLTVIENVLIGTHCLRAYGLFNALLHGRHYKSQESLAIEDAHACVEALGLSDYTHYKASSLPYGLQKRLEIDRALATKPRLLLLDEPSAGMNPAETIELMQLIRELNSNGLSILLIEHDMNLVMNLSDQVVVLNYGVKIAEGKPEQIRNNPEVVEAYLGKGVQCLR